MNFAGSWSKLRQLNFADQNFLLARRRVHVPEFAVLALIIALHERYFGAVRTPLDGLRSTSRNSTFREDLLNRQLLRGIAAGCICLSGTGAKQQ